MPKCVIVSGADPGYFPLLKDCFTSIRSFPALADIDICALDFDLKQDQRDWLTANGAQSIVPEWHIDFRNRSAMPTHYKAMTARPFLPQYFAGHDIIMWLDADIWVQDPEYVRLYLIGAERYGFTVVSEMDRAYGIIYGEYSKARDSHHLTYAHCFGRQTADEMIHFPIINSGAFAIRRNHPIWGAWQKNCRQAIELAPLKLAEQAALNLAVYTSDAAQRPHMLPALANWICSLALPLWNASDRKLLEPNLPQRPLGLVHMTGLHQAMTLQTVTGQSVTTGLQYSAIRKLGGGP